ncbi:MAG: transposase [Chloroflexota bacterium]|nr:MAG: transposase [Chloroflexota bacterium]
MTTGGDRRWPDLGWRRKRLRLPSFDYCDPHHIYFVTLCARHQSVPFSNPSLANQVTEAILFRAARGDWHAYAYCLMPDHLHLALTPVPDKDSVSKSIQGFKTWTTRLAWQHGLQGALWQRSYYDHIARRDEDVRAICMYILANPVRKGLVDSPEAWPYSGTPDPLPA